MLNSNTLNFKNNHNVIVGLDIGGSLTKLSIMINKSLNSQEGGFLTKYEFLEEIDLENNFLYIKLILTSNFNTEGISLLKSRINIYKRHKGRIFIQ
jgi:hypothetical protein